VVMRNEIVTRGLSSRLRVVVCAVAAASMLVTGASPVAGADGGVDLSARSNAPDERWSSLAYGAGVWVAVSTTGDVMTSSDGMDWTQTRTANDGTWHDLIYANGLFVALNGTRTSATQAMTSTDGVTWTTHAGVSGIDWRSLAYGAGLFVAVGWDNLRTNQTVMTSPDGATWTSRNSADDTKTWLGVTYADGRFVAVAQGTSTRSAAVMYSTDGINWTSGVAPSPTTRGWQAVTYGGGLFVATSGTCSGCADQVMTSSDGVTWTTRSSSASKSWGSIAYGDGLFVAVSNYGGGVRVMTSPDGITWTSRTAAVSQAWSEVRYGNGTFVAVAGGSGLTDRVMSSVDGINWSLGTAQSITFAEPASQSLGDGSLALSASASSSLSVSYASSTTSVCTVSGSTVSFVAAGTCSITASQSGDSTYAAADDVTRSFAITAPAPSGGGGGGGGGSSAGSTETSETAPAGSGAGGITWVPDRVLDRYVAEGSRLSLSAQVTSPEGERRELTDRDVMQLVAGDLVVLDLSGASPPTDVSVSFTHADQAVRDRCTIDTVEAPGSAGVFSFTVSPEPGCVGEWVATVSGRTPSGEVFALSAPVVVSAAGGERALRGFTMKGGGLFKKGTAKVSARGERKLGKLASRIPEGASAQVGITGVSASKKGKRANTKLAKERCLVLEERIRELTGGSSVEFVHATVAAKKRGGKVPRAKGVARSKRGKPLTTFTVTYP